MTWLLFGLLLTTPKAHEVAITDLLMTLKEFVCDGIITLHAAGWVVREGHVCLLATASMAIALSAHTLGVRLSVYSVTACWRSELLGHA